MGQESQSFTQEEKEDLESKSSAKHKIIYANCNYQENCLQYF